MAKHRILLVDDQEDFRDALARFLATRGFEVIQSANVTEALPFLEAGLSLVLCDLWMDHSQNGTELLFALRKNPQTAKIPFILMTGGLSPEILDKAGFPTVSACLEKPFSFLELLETVFRHLG